MQISGFTYEASIFKVVKMFMMVLLLTFVSSLTLGLCGYLPLNYQIRNTLDDIKLNNGSFKLFGEIDFKTYFKEYWLPVCVPLFFIFFPIYLLFMSLTITSVAKGMNPSRILLHFYLILLPFLLFAQSYSYKKVLNMIGKNFNMYLDTKETE